MLEKDYYKSYSDFFIKWKQILNERQQDLSDWKKIHSEPHLSKKSKERHFITDITIKQGKKLLEKLEKFS